MPVIRAKTSLFGNSLIEAPLKYGKTVTLLVHQQEGGVFTGA
jgi:hypothetical protein